MKRIAYIVCGVLLALAGTACTQESHFAPDGTPVVNVKYTNLTKGAVTEGDLYDYAVTGSGEGSTLSLDFHTSQIFLAPGIYKVGTEDGQVNGHFKGDGLDNDIVSGSITVTLEGETSYTVSGTVRLNDEGGTPVRVRATGDMNFDIPTYYYYTDTPNGKVNGINAHIYRIYDMNTSVQLAEIAVVGDGVGTYTVSNSGDAGSAVYGSVEGGCWFYKEGYGTHMLCHGDVTISEFPNKKNFKIDDTVSGEYLCCALKQDLEPALAIGEGISFMRLTFSSVPSPVVKDMYEYTVKMFYDNGQELFSMTAVTPTPNPIMELIEKEGKTGGYPFQTKVSYDEYLKLSASGDRCAIDPICYYVCNGIRYAIPDGFAFVVNAKLASGIVAGLLAPTNMSYSLPPELQAYLDGVGGSIWGLIGYVY